MAKNTQNKPVDEEVVDTTEPTETEEVIETDEPTEEELEARRLEAKKQIDAKMQAKREASKASSEADQQLFTKEQTEEMIQNALEKFSVRFKKDLDEDDIIDPDKPKTFAVTVPRINNKMIVGFKNLNNDPYRPGEVVYAHNLARKDDSTGKTIVEPWVTVIWRKSDVAEGEEPTKEYPLDYIVKNTIKVDCILKERKQVDASYDFGVIEETEVKDYNKAGKGTFVKAKVTQFKESFLVTDPKSGEDFIVAPEVVNWAQVKKTDDQY